METKNRTAMHVTGNPKRRKASAGKRPRKEPQIQIVYTPAKPFNRNRFLLRLATVAAVVLALVLGMSIFFRAEQVTVSGAEKYTPWEIREASGIGDSDGLLGISEAKISARIRTKLPYVDTVRVGIKLPNTVNIEITELSAVYAIEGDQNTWWLMDAQGRIVDQTNAAAAYTQILGVKITGAVVGEQAVALEPEEPETTENTQEESAPTVPTLPAVPARQNLEAALQVLAALEANGVLGSIETVNVSDTKQLTMWYGNRYHVTLGDTGRMEYKVGAMKAAIQKMGEYQNGYLDVSFTMWPDQVGYTPFDGDINA